MNISDENTDAFRNNARATVVTFCIPWIQSFLHVVVWISKVSFCCTSVNLHNNASAIYQWKAFHSYGVYAAMQKHALIFMYVLYTNTREKTLQGSLLLFLTNLECPESIFADISEMGTVFLLYANRWKLVTLSSLCWNVLNIVFIIFISTLETYFNSFIGWVLDYKNKQTNTKKLYQGLAAGSWLSLSYNFHFLLCMLEREQYL